MDILENYQHFHMSHRLEKYQHKLGTISYRKSGNSVQNMVVFMHGLMFDNRAYFQLFSILNKRFTIISIETLKPLNKDKDKEIMIHDLLQSMGMSKVHVLGINLGGLIALNYTVFNPGQIETISLFQPFIYTKTVNSDQINLISHIKEVINALDELRKTFTIKDTKMALLEEIRDITEKHNKGTFEHQMDYFQYLLSLYQLEDEIDAINLLKNYLNNEPNDFSRLRIYDIPTYLTYGHDDDPFFGSQMVDCACDILSYAKIEALDMSRYDIMLKPHLFAYKIIKFIESLNFF